MTTAPTAAVTSAPVPALTASAAAPPAPLHMVTDTHPSPAPGPQLPPALNTGATANATTSVSSIVATNLEPIQPGNVRLLTATANIAKLGDHSTHLETHILLDSGSQPTFVTSRVAIALQLAVVRQEQLQISTFAGETPLFVQVDVVQCALQLHDGSSITLEANVLPRITDPVHHQAISTADKQILLNLPAGSLAEPIPDGQSSHTVDVLIGSGYFWDIIDGSRSRLPSGLFMVPSKLGVLVTGVQGTRDNKNTITDTVLCATVVSTLPDVDLTRMWALDTIGISGSPTVVDDDVALAQFQSTVRIVNQRYEVRWPWRDEVALLPSNYGLALGRLRTLGKRLMGDPQLLQQYSAILQQQLDLGIVEKITPHSATGPTVHYLPHQPVVKPMKSTTKVRIVYDASE